MGEAGAENKGTAYVKSPYHPALPFSGACEVEPDKQGRILIPANLREFAGLEKDILVIGASNRAEIWNRSRWENACSDLNSDAIAQAMDELGF